MVLRKADSLPPEMRSIREIINNKLNVIFEFLAEEGMVYGIEGFGEVKEQEDGYKFFINALTNERFALELSAC